MTERGWKATTMNHYAIFEATGDRADKLKAEHEQIAVLSDPVMSLRQTFQGGPSDDDLKTRPGMETFCAHLADVRNPTGVPDMDDATTIWQMNWATATSLTIHELGHRDQFYRDGKIWARVDLSDVTGTVPVRLPEPVALQLSASTDRDAFIRSVTDGDPIFPTMLSVKIARKQRAVNNSGGEGADTPEPQTANTYVNYTILDACAQQKDHVRSKTALELAPLLRHLSTMTSAIMPARLSMIVHSKAHPLSIQYNADVFPCMRAWTVIMTKAKSSCTLQAPFVVTTRDVMDGAQEPQNPDRMLTMKILCNEQNRAAFLLVPKHGKPVYALAIVNSVTPTEVYAETIEQITAEEALALSRAIDVEMTLADCLVKLHNEGRGYGSASQNEYTWTPQKTPLNGKTCRALGRSPTEAECPPMKMPKVDTAKTD